MCVCICTCMCVCVYFFLLIGYYDPLYYPLVTIFQSPPDLAWTLDSHTQDKNDPDL